jgi:hypothetical protein
MGIALWLGCALVVFLAARRVRHARPARWAVELIAAIGSALALGLIATTLDFGGWKEADWRAAVFAFFGSAAVVGALRFRHLAARNGNV